jgi:hypothetical protein
MNAVPIVILSGGTTMRHRTEIGSLYAYEIDDGSSVYWDIFTEDRGESYNPIYLTTVEAEDFGDYLDTARGLGYTLLINTYESWLKEIDDDIDQLPS